MEVAVGVHTIYAKVKAKVSTQIRCEVIPVLVPPTGDTAAVSSLVQVTAPTWMPDVVAGQFAGEGVSSVVLLNRHPSSALTNISVDIPHHERRAGRARGYVTIDFDKQSKLSQPTHLAPSQLSGFHVALRVHTEDASSAQDDSALCPSSFTIVVQGLLEGRAWRVQTGAISVRCRRRHNQSFILSFIDHDGAANRAAVIAPLRGCLASDASSRESCPVILTMHGTGVTENNQADAYKQEVSKDVWEFGVGGAWLVAATRFGAHNWEGTGMRSALAAIEALAAWTSLPEGGCSNWGYLPADSRRVVFAGHSMGGHGAWHIATHWPDLALAVSTAAGWIRKEYYGDSNNLWDHDLGVAHVDATLKGLLESAVQESYVDLLAPNLKGTPVLARIGSEDHAVPPWQQRRMFRHLAEHGVVVHWDEVPGQQHWWWDSLTSSDGGCVNDDIMRAFFAAPLQNVSTPSPASAFATKKKGKGSKGGEGKRPVVYPEKRDMTAGAWPTQAAAPSFVPSVPPLPDDFELVLVNPAASGARGGLRVLQLQRPFVQGRIRCRKETRDGDGGGQQVRWVLHTRNIRRFALQRIEGSRLLHPFLEAQGGMEVDGVAVSARDTAALLDGFSDTQPHMCLLAGGGEGRGRAGGQKRWRVCDKDEEAVGAGPEKNLASYGPARQVFEAPFLIVAGAGAHTAAREGGACTKGAGSGDLRAAAVYLANLHRAAYETNVGVWSDGARHSQVDGGAGQLPAVPTELLEQMNVVLVGGPSVNALTNQFLRRGLIPVSFGPKEAKDGEPAIPADGFSIGRCVFAGAGIGLVTTFPMRSGLDFSRSSPRGGSLGLLVAGTDASGLRDALTQGQPTIPPMVRAPYTNMQPDFVVTGPDFAWKGVGGILAAGYWGNLWQFDPSTAYTQDDCSL